MRSFYFVRKRDFLLFSAFEYSGSELWAIAYSIFLITQPFF